MERPAVFMISITVLYCLTLAFLSHLSILQLNQENFSNKKFDNLISKVYHIQIPWNSQSTVLKSLQINSVDPFLLEKESLSFTVKSLEFSVFSVGSVYFELQNHNFFYTPVQVLMVQSNSTRDLNCQVFNDRGVAPPLNNFTLGPLICESSQNGNSNLRVLIIHDGKLLEQFSINIEFKGPALQISHVEGMDAKMLQKFRIINVGDSSVLILGTFFESFSYCETYFEILNCFKQFELGQEESFDIDILGYCYLAEGFLSTSILVKTSYGIFTLPINLKLNQEAGISYSKFILWLITCLILYFSRTSLQKFKIISSQDKTHNFTEMANLRRYSRPVISNKRKTHPNQICIIKPCLVFDQFTITSETTDTHLNSPTSSSNSEDLQDEDDYFLDSYKMTGIFSVNPKNSFNSF